MYPAFSLLSTTSSPTELSITLKMEAADSFQMSEQIPHTHHIFKNLCVNLKTYMTTVAAICQIPVTEAQNTVLEGPSLERAMKSRYEIAAWN